MAVAISAVASDTGKLNSHGTTSKKSSDIPGPDVEIISSKPKGPAAQ
jgi:hypothetical protein